MHLYPKIMSFKRNLFIPTKNDYIRGRKRPAVDCILCSIIENNPLVDCLLIWKNELLGISVNLYPYNAGHLLIFPVRHIKDVRELTKAEAANLFELTKICLSELDKLYEPHGYNIGFNIGDASGASIEHLHQHIVPRYPKELGFVDIVSGAKIIIEDPKITMKRLREAFSKAHML